MNEQTDPEQPIVRWSLHTGPPKDGDEGIPADRYDAAGVSWSGVGSGSATVTHLMVGDDVYDITSGEAVKVGSDGWRVRLGVEGGALEVGPFEEDEDA